MLEHWLQTIKTADIEGFDKLESWQFGRKIALYTEGSNLDLKTTQVAIVGIGDDADDVRAQLYRLSCPFSATVAVADLGNLRKQEMSFIIPFLSELLQGGIVPIVIGYVEDFTLAQFQAFHQKKNSVSLTLIDERIRYAPQVKTDNYFLHQIMSSSHLFNLSVVGYQAHFSDPSVISIFETKSFELVRLGKTRAALEDVEPIIRDADLVSFNLAALKLSDAPAQLDGSPSGLTAEEACQLSRYAGMSDKLTSFGIYGFRRSLDRDALTAQVVAQMIWYFIDGFSNRKFDFPTTKSFADLTEYIVDIKSFDYRLTFWRSNKSGRWWMEMPVRSRRKHERHRLVPCSYNDYLQACNDDLPERDRKSVV